MLDSDQRLSAAEALAHAYFSQYHDPEDEPEAEPYDESVEATERTLEEWKGGPGGGGRCGAWHPGVLWEGDSTLLSPRPLQGLVRDGLAHPAEQGAAQRRLWQGRGPRLPSHGGGPGLVAAVHCEGGTGGRQQGLTFPSLLRAHLPGSPQLQAPGATAASGQPGRGAVSCSGACPPRSGSGPDLAPQPAT